MEHRYICIEGNIGSGKTTLCNMLSQTWPARLVLEAFADNPFLPQFYRDPDRYAFSVELFFMAERYKQLQDEIVRMELFDRLIISDYLFEKTRIFAHKNLNDNEFKLFRQLYDMLYLHIPKPDKILYIHRPVEVLLDQIAMRGRSFEKHIKADYLLSIQDAYFRYLKESENLPVVIAHLGDKSFETDTILFEGIKNLIERPATKKIQHVAL